MRYKHSAGKGSYDLYVVFVERSLELLNAQGQLAFILPHKFFNQQYGEPLRGWLADGKHLRHVVHFKDHQIFPGATNYVCLLFLSKSPSDSFVFVKVDNFKLWLATTQGSKGIFPANEVTANEWGFSVGANSGLVERLKALPTKLGDIADIFVGLQTSADDVFMMLFVSETPETITLKSKVLDQNWVFEKDLFHPVMSGTDVRPFAALPHRQFILFPYEVENEEASLIPFATLKKRFPKTAAYLEKNHERLAARESRKFDDSSWHRFGRNQNLGIQERKKICVPRLVEKLNGTLDIDGKHYLDNVDVGGITICPEQLSDFSLTYLLAVINSSVARWFFPNVSAPFRGGWWSANRQFVSRLPVILPTAEQRSACDLFVEQLLWLRRQPTVTQPDRNHPQDPLIASYFEQMVNALVYELFFPEELHTAGLHFFELAATTPIAKPTSPPAIAAGMDWYREQFKKLSAPGHPLRVALDKLQTLDLVRIIEGHA